MSKPDAFRLCPATYPFSTEVRTRYSDLDPQNHINNVAVAAIYEEGRSQFIHWLVGNVKRELEPPRRMIAEVRVRYLAQIHYPATLTVAAGILSIGQRSYCIGQALFQNGQCVGVCETAVVHSDGLQGIALSENWREALQLAATQS
jgi:acyl-CoA thioester hydrolase